MIGLTVLANAGKCSDLNRKCLDPFVATFHFHIFLDTNVPRLLAIGYLLQELLDPLAKGNVSLVFFFLLDLEIFDLTPLV